MNFLEALEKTIIKEALTPEFAVGFAGIDSDESQWRSLSQSKDMSDYSYSRILQIVRWYSKTNPLAQRIVTLTKDFVIGSGLTYEAENPKVKACLNSFWYNSLNNLILNHHKKINQLTIFGEQAYTVTTNEQNGNIKLGYISPDSIDTIKTNPDNIEDIKQIKVKAKAGEDPKVYDIVKLNEETGYLEGEAFYFRINNLDDEVRGYSDLLPILDWLDVYDSIMMNEADRIRLINSFVWDILLRGMNDEQIQKWLNENGKPPKPGSVRAHNENAEWNAVSPNLNTSESTNFLKFLLSFMLGGVGIPEHFFSLAFDINRATAQAMDPPLVKRIQSRQEYIRFMFGSIFDYAIDKAIIHKKQLIDRDTGKGLGTLKEKEDLSYKIIMPDPSKKDLIGMAQSLMPFANSLVTAKNQGWLSSKTSGRVYIQTLNETGAEIDIDEEQELIKEEKTEDQEDIYKRTPLPEIPEIPEIPNETELEI